MIHQKVVHDILFTDQWCAMKMVKQKRIHKNIIGYIKPGFVKGINYYVGLYINL